MIYQVPLWFIITFLSVLILSFIYGAFWLRKHNKKEKERQEIERGVKQIGKHPSS